MSRGIYSSCKLCLVLVHSSSWWIPPLRFAAVGMTKWGDVFGIIGNSSVLSGAERHIGRSLRFRWEVLPLRLLFLQCGTPLGPLSLGCAETALPKGEPRGSFRYVFPLRPLFLQCGTLYRIPSSVSPSGEPASPEGSSCTVLLGGRFNGPTPQRSGTVNCQLSTVNFLPFSKNA